MATEADLLNDWDLGTVERAIEYCASCQQQIRCGVVKFDDGTVRTLNSGYMHRDGSRAGLFVAGARVAKRKDSDGYSVVSVLLHRNA